MPIIVKFIHILCFITFLTACNNALYFYETEKISLTVEARPDSSQPIQGNLGLKQRIALVTPGKSKDKGEALSSISSFRFKVAPESNDFFNGFNPVLIRTAFITGDAASGLTNEEAEAAAIVLSDASILSGNDFIYFRNLISVLSKDATQGIAEANSILAGLNKINTLLLPDTYPVSTYGLDTQNKLSEDHLINSKINHNKSINGLLDFLGELRLSKKAIQAVLKKPNLYTVLDSPATNSFILTGLKTTVSNTEQLMKEIGNKLKSDPVYNSAIQYYINNIIKGAS